MRRTNLSGQSKVFFFLTIVLLVGMAVSIPAEDAAKAKKFLTKPLVIEDQGSFFIGGVPKVTNYATLPAANATNAPLTPNQITIGQMCFFRPV